MYYNNNKIIIMMMIVVMVMMMMMMIISKIYSDSLRLRYPNVHFSSVCDIMFNRFCKHWKTFLWPGSGAPLV